MPKPGHIFQGLDPQGAPNTDPQDEDLLRGSSLKVTQGTILKRMILQILPFLGEWGRENYERDPSTRRVIEDVKANKDLYNEVNTAQWAKFLGKILQQDPEVHIWKNSPESIFWLSDPKKNPFVARAKELVDIDDEDTILIGWNQYCGVIACEILQGDKPLEERNPLFPRINSKVFCRLFTDPGEKKEAAYPEAQLCIWAWDKRNFQNPLT